MNCKTTETDTYKSASETFGESFGAGFARGLQVGKMRKLCMISLGYSLEGKASEQPVPEYYKNPATPYPAPKGCNWIRSSSKEYSLECVDKTTSDYASSDAECLTGDVPVNCSCVDAEPEANGIGYGSGRLILNCY